MVQRVARPPDLPGYTYVEIIGQGGFADVFLYRQHLPSRAVAIKVLLESAIDGEARRRFDAEANVMAQLSTHPSIVPIYQADVSADGRPFLAMEYCPRPNLAVRSRRERLSVQESIEIGIKVSGAVETAHRAGILHRDIKPHNILTNAYDQPKLADFGIAVVAGEGRDLEVGLSVPWSPPEMFGSDPPEDVRSDVYSLAATVYTLLAGRSPFEVAGGANDQQVLMDRIQHQQVPRLTRADVPDKLNDVLLRALSKDPEDRHASANGFARALQDVQIGMHLSPTRIDVLDSSAERPVVADDDGRTRISPIAVIDPDITAPTGTAAPVSTADVEAQFRTSPPGAEPSTRPGRKPTSPPSFRPPAGLAPGTTARRGPPQAPGQPGRPVVDTSTGPPAAAPQAPRRPRGLKVAALLAAVVVVAGLVVAVVVGGDPASEPSRPGLGAGAGTGDSGDVVIGGTVPAVTALVGVRAGSTVTFTWTNPAPEDGDFYVWSRQGDPTPPQRTVGPTLSFEAQRGSSTCVRVQLARADGGLTPETTAPVACAEQSP